MKRRILSFLLAFLMVAGMFPASAFAADDAELPENTEQTPCGYCGEYNCEKNHCKECGVVDCTEHVEGTEEEGDKPCCNVIDGVHEATCENYTCPRCGAAEWHETCPVTEEPTDPPAAPEVHPDTGKMVKFSGTWPWMYRYADNSNDCKQVDVSKFPAALRVAKVEMVGNTKMYMLEITDGSAWPTVYEGYVYIDSTKVEDAKWCDSCNKYECGKEHTTEPENPCDCGCETCTGAEGCECKCGNCNFCEKEPENTCDCGCENCTGAEGCECKCGNCDFCEKEPENPCACCDSCTGAEDCECQCGNCEFCEKPEEPTVPSISDTVNGQTVTVTGAALPEGATLKVTESTVHKEMMGHLFENKDLTAFYDISIGNDKINGSVTLTFSGFPFITEDNVTIIHFLDDADAIVNAGNAGLLHDLDISGIAESATLFEKEIAAAMLALEQMGVDSSNSSAVPLFYTVTENVPVVNGTVQITTDSFSIYALSGSTYAPQNGGSSGSGKDNSYQFGYCDGTTVYLTRNQQFYCEVGRYYIGNPEWSGGSDYGTWGDDRENRTPFTVSGSANYYTKFDLQLKYFSTQNWNTKYYYSTVHVYVVPEITIKYDTHGGSAVSNQIAVLGNGTSAIPYTSIKLPAAPTKTGYTFQGWYSALTDDEKIGNANATLTVNTTNGFSSDKLERTFHAKWDAIDYTVKFDPNTANAGGSAVTGSMSNLSMTYDVETTLPRNQFVNQGDGMVFLGWATSPDGDVVYKDGAKIKNLTATNDDTVTLYAKWKYGLASTVYIGINNTYHNPNGTYTAGGVTINSYHTYPNEPAQMTGDFDRVTDTSGGWTYNSESAVPLKNQAASYINGNIFNSPDYEMTYVEGENTLGIADPTGSAVRSMLKFTEADYNAMIAVWLEGMRNTLVGYGDTSFDWQNAKASDFTIVPYVIKFQNYDSWYIDMVVVPKALYTLAYDGNIENGYTASFTGVAFPPSSQYTDGSTVNVVTTPIGYQNNNMKVTKVIDGYTYTAAFQYWYDANGNTYGGNTGRNTIKLTANTILYAKWEYPDASFGNLNITKTVVDKDAYENPASGQNFTFKFTTSASGSYYYTIYDQSANVKNSGTIANNGTFILQDGWRIRITDLPMDATYSVTETAVNYYTASGTVSGTISAGATTYATVTNTYQKYAEYTVKHYLKDAEGDEYKEQTADRQKLYGVIGEKTAAAGKTTYTGYKAKSFNQEVIQKDGSTVIDIYYDINSHTVKASGDANVTITGDVEQTVSHGQENEPIVFEPKDGYRISKVTINSEEQTGFDETEYTFQQTIDEDVTIYVTTEKAVADLTISISGNISGQNYVFSVTNSKGAEVNRVVLYTDKTSITICNLPVDTYKVTPVSGWAWRQNVTSVDANAELPTQNTVTFVCSSNGLVKWLNGFNNDGKKKGG